MTRRRKAPLQPLLITDNRTLNDWIPVSQLPENHYGWSKSVLVCQFVPGNHPTLLIASYDFIRHNWRAEEGIVNYVTRWQPLP
jgi:hypothetical protein